MQVFTKSIKLAIGFLFIISASLVAQAPDFSWVKTAGSTKLDYGNALTEDAAGNIYLTGEFNGTIDFGSSVVLTSAGNVDFFLVKFDPQGKAIWGRSGGGTLTDRGYGVVIDKSGNIVVTGHYYATAKFENVSLTSMGNLDAFTAKYDTAGKLIWIREGKSVSQVSTRAIAEDGSGNSYITGYFGSSTANTVKFDTLTLTSLGQRDIFLVKYDSLGNVKWGVNMGGNNSSEEGKDVAVDGAGNIYVAGMFVDTAYFGSERVIGYGGSDIFVAKYSPDGKIVWVKSAGGPKDDIGYGIACDHSGNIFLSGKFDSVAVIGNKNLTSNGVADAFISKLDSSGNFLWTDTFGGTGADNCSAVKTDDAGYCIGYGSFNDTVGFGNESLVSAGMDDIFFVKLDPSGNVAWVKQAGGSDKDAATSLIVEKNGSIAATGYFNYNASFGSTQVTSNGAQDVFLCKLISSIVPVELVSFKGLAESGKVILSWSTATETNNSGFALERSSDNSAFAKIGFVKGNGTTTERTDYSFIDENISGSKYYYRLKQIDFDGTFKYSSIVEVSLNAPGRFNLYQNYPNPFNPATSIAFDLPVASQVSIKIYNCLGKEIDILSNKDFLAGRSEVKFDASGFASGVYFYKVEAFGNDGSSFSNIRKMIIMK